MSRVKTNGNAPEFRELEVAAKDDRWFWTGWIVTTAAIFVAGCRELPSLTRMSLPFWLLWFIGFATCQAKGWAAIIWSRNGREVLKIFPDHVQYYSVGGAIFDRRKISFPLEPIETPVVEVLTFGLGANAVQNRVHVKAVRGSVYWAEVCQKRTHESFSELSLTGCAHLRAPKSGVKRPALVVHGPLVSRQ